MQDVEELIGLAPEKVLLKWMNFHLKKAGYKKTVTNFSSDVKVSGHPDSYSVEMWHCKSPRLTSNNFMQFLNSLFKWWDGVSILYMLNMCKKGHK